MGGRRWVQSSGTWVVYRFDYVFVSIRTSRQSGKPNISMWAIGFRDGGRSEGYGAPMDVRQLAALVAIADHGTFSAAARALFTVQSNVSSHVARLEKELGTELVDRAHGGLTDDGARVGERARRILPDVHHIPAE